MWKAKISPKTVSYYKTLALPAKNTQSPKSFDNASQAGAGLKSNLKSHTPIVLTVQRRAQVNCKLFSAPNCIFARWLKSRRLNKQLILRRFGIATVRKLSVMSRLEVLFTLLVGLKCRLLVHSGNSD